MVIIDPEELQVGWFVLVRGDVTEYVVARVTAGETDTMYGLRRRHGSTRVRKTVDWKQIVAVSKMPFITTDDLQWPALWLLASPGAPPTSRYPAPPARHTPHVAPALVVTWRPAPPGAPPTRPARAANPTARRPVALGFSYASSLLSPGRLIDPCVTSVYPTSFQLH
ncbi:hypothetical protein GGTG_12064 [Gaeumannomyces tritici R3-111a-1]|uniref:Uncharacterized protein n=1 Tax=Gaeumannomyces tritici (strain R3-111a-1) TaxID=644352 RepID=J3PEY5_GAET3|nr:hypothetical protein GGTG_12064 [Gaeumannomyces tritici R3-111a-1]EJT71043.1 hypothetical protein GGTG_12064 [Gaeumannomyces tritici R3-111a-1]